MKRGLFLVGVNVALLLFVWPAVGKTDPLAAQAGTMLAVIGIATGVIAVLCRMARR